jgi:predicted metal-binding protein
MTTWITICDTCKREGWDAGEMAKSDGELLAEFIEAKVDSNVVRTRRVSCLMGCTHGCNVAIQANGKLAYTVGNFVADPESADAIVAYAELHAVSENGQVPYRQWPPAIKGHFITRHQPLPENE